MSVARNRPLSVSLNGVDNVGKTTQLAWLRRGVPGAQLVGGIDAWDPRWQVVAAGDFAQWWFVDSSTAEHVGLMFSSHAARRAASRPFALEDRGLPMIRAACAATVVIKVGLSVPAALGLVDRLAVDLLPATRRDEFHVLLRRWADPEREAAAALTREQGPVGDRYAAYGHALAEALAVLAGRGDFDAVLDVADSGILDVQRRLRRLLAGSGVPVETLPDARVDRLWVLGGMSESGKSTVGELLRVEHGTARLKIGYLLEVAAARVGTTDPYAAWSEAEQAEALSEEVLRFAAANKAAAISVESAHRLAATTHLKRLWGEVCQVVYLQADRTVRERRSAESSHEIEARDATKRARGADRIVGIADHVLDNSGSPSALVLSVARLVTSVDSDRGGTREPSTVSTAEAGLAAVVSSLADEQVALVLATGSTATSAWRPGWSDVDLLVVRDTAPMEWLRSASAVLSAMGGVKAALSVFTTGDVEALRVPPRVLRSLRRASAGLGVLHRRTGYSWPVPTHERVDRASRDELGLVVMTTRRLLGADPIDVRAVHKHVVLLVKIVLRADGQEADTADEVLAAFDVAHRTAGVELPDLDDLIASRDDPAVIRQLGEAADRLLAYLDRLDHAVRSTA